MSHPPPPGSVASRPLAWLILVLVAGALGGCFPPAAARKAARRDGLAPDSRELKLLLDGARFAEDRPAAARSYWDLVTEVARSLGIRVKPRYRGDKERRRSVVFFDTVDHALRSRGLILRQRIRYEGDEPERRAEYSLKARSTSLDVAASADLRSPGLREDRELEEDVTLAPASPTGTRTVYAARNRVRIEHEVPHTVAGFGALFPVLRSLGLPADTPLIPVNAIRIDERRFSPGKLKLGGGVTAKADVTVWLDAQGQVLLGEFSFDHRLGSSKPAAEEGARKGLDLLRSLRERSAEWLAPGTTTKTAFTYGAKRAQAAP